MTRPAIRLMKTWPLRPNPVWIDVYFYFIVFSIWRADSFTSTLLDSYSTRFILASHFAQAQYIYFNWILVVPFDDDMNMNSFYFKTSSFITWIFLIFEEECALIFFPHSFLRFPTICIGDRSTHSQIIYAERFQSQCGQIKHDNVENCLRRCETNTSDGLLGLQTVLLLLLLLALLLHFISFILRHEA